MTADIFADGHDILYAVLDTARQLSADWEEVPMEAQPNDRWQAEFTVPAQGPSPLHPASLARPLSILEPRSGEEVCGGTRISVDILSGVQLITAAVARAGAKDKALLTTAADEIDEAGRD